MALGIGFAFSGTQEGSDMSVNGTAVNESVNGNASRTWRQPRGVGRPSTVAPFAPQIEAWLRESPTLSGAELLRRAREVGYRGGKSALYELVRRLRIPVAASQTVVPSNASR
jgi:hypothetical protein